MLLLQVEMSKLKIYTFYHPPPRPSRNNWWIVATDWGNTQSVDLQNAKSIIWNQLLIFVQGHQYVRLPACHWNVNMSLGTLILVLFTKWSSSEAVMTTACPSSSSSSNPCPTQSDGFQTCWFSNWFVNIWVPMLRFPTGTATFSIYNPYARRSYLRRYNL